MWFKLSLLRLMDTQRHYMNNGKFCINNKKGGDYGFTYSKR